MSIFLYITDVCFYCTDFPVAIELICWNQMESITIVKTINFVKVNSNFNNRYEYEISALQMS